MDSMNEETIRDDIARPGQGKRRYSQLSLLSPAKRQLHSSFLEGEQTEQSYMASAEPPPYFTVRMENAMRSSADIDSHISELDVEAACKTGTMSEYTVKIAKPNHSSENHDSLKSRHPLSHETYCTLYLKLRRLALILTAILLLIVILPVFLGIFGDLLPDFVSPRGRVFHKEGIGLPGISAMQKSFAINSTSGFVFSQEVRQSFGIDGSSLAKVHVDGIIHIKPATEALDSNIRVDLVSHASHHKLIHLEALEAPDSSIIMTSPSNVPTSRVDGKKGAAYIHAQITIWVKPGVILPKFKIKTQSLSIVFHPGLQYHVEDTLKLVTTKGSIKFPIFPFFDPATSIYLREVIIQTTSGSVKGAYPLYDLLSIDTQSGSIDIDLDLREVSMTAPKPAVLHLGTFSGAVRVNTPSLTAPSAVIPLRDYQSDINLMSSSLDATIPHGSITNLRSQSGRISAALYPCGDPATLSGLSSDSKSGATHIRLHRSPTHPTSPLRKLNASHKQQSGSLRLHYPAQWEGHITGETMSGSVRVGWPGVKIISDHKGPVGRRVQAEKGHGEGELRISSLSGSVELVGDI